MMEAPANLFEKLEKFTDRFSPRTIATYNDNDIMVAKLEGPFPWHTHDQTDDLFLVLHGTLDIELRDRTVTLRPGEVFARKCDVAIVAIPAKVLRMRPARSDGANDPPVPSSGTA